MAASETTAIVAGMALAVTSPILGPPLLTLPVVAGAIIGSVVALLYYVKSQPVYDVTAIIDTVLIFVTGIAAAIFGTSTVAYFLDTYFGLSGDGVGLIALVLSFQGQQMFAMVSNLKALVMKKFGV